MSPLNRNTRNAILLLRAYIVISTKAAHGGCVEKSRSQSNSNIRRWGAKEAVPQWGICRRQKRPERVLTCAVREAGIPPAVRARIHTETSNATAPREQCAD